ncbi:MAG: CoA-binding protein [Pseudomonadales bacterium]|nr:CoA-binding protein [Pseudomonadales bacterium]
MTHVAILGASPKPHRFAYKCQQKLIVHGHTPWPVAKRGGEINGISCVKHLSELTCPIDTVTVYINATLMQAVIDELINIAPNRVIFNPGTESTLHQKKLEDKGIQVLNACTLILLDQQQF